MAAAGLRRVGGDAGRLPAGLLSSFRLLEYLQRFTRGAALLLVTAGRRPADRRPCPTAGPAATSLTLGPLPPEEAVELAGTWHRPRPGDTTVRRVAAMAEGNPLVVEELLRGLQGPGPAGGARHPPAVQALIEAELDALPPEERLVLEVASVVGRAFDWASVAALTPATASPAGRIPAARPDQTEPAPGGRPVPG